MNPNFKRPKILESRTEAIDTGCGKLHITLGFMDTGALVEVRAVIGKNGICPNVGLDTVSKCLSIILQSPLSRDRIKKKLRKQFVGISCGEIFKIQEKEYKSCYDFVTQRMLKEL